jgi:hypothetical protein
LTIGITIVPRCNAAFCVNRENVSQDTLLNPYLATLFTFIIALAFLRLMDYLAHHGIIESKLSRKIIHIGTGPIFVLCWLMYPDMPISRWLAALVPLLNLPWLGPVSSKMRRQSRPCHALATGVRFCAARYSMELCSSQ